MTDDSYLHTVVRNQQNTGCMFYCAGCDQVHIVYLTEPGYPHWTYNGNSIKPTFSPSVLVTWDQRSPENRRHRAAFVEQHGREPTLQELPYDVHNVCHSFVRDGMIQYLGDSTHRLANNTLPLLPFEQWYGQDA